MDRGALWATVLGVARVRHELATKHTHTEYRGRILATDILVRILWGLNFCAPCRDCEQRVVFPQIHSPLVCRCRPTAGYKVSERLYPQVVCGWWGPVTRLLLMTVIRSDGHGFQVSSCGH